MLLSLATAGVVILAAIYCVLLSIRSTLRSALSELGKIQRATVSLHDRVVPEVLMRRWDRVHRR